MGVQYKSDFTEYFRAGNVIIGSCNEYTGDPDDDIHHDMEPRLLGLAMVPGHHITKMWVDTNTETIRANSPHQEEDEAMEQNL